MYLRGLLLPIWSHVFQGIRETRERGHLCIMWGVLGAAILEALTLTETGFRANDGNFEWGSLTLCPTVFAVAITLLWRLLGRTDWKKRPELLRAVVGIILLLGHLAVGAYCLYRPGHADYDWFYFINKDIYRTKAVLQIAFGCDITPAIKYPYAIGLYSRSNIINAIFLAPVGATEKYGNY